MIIWLLCGLWLAPMAAAQDRADAIEAAWANWLEAGGTEESTLAILRNGAFVRSLGRGVAADAALPLASLSKAITAVCAAEYLAMEDTVGAVLGDAGPVADVTVSALITHSAGIWPDGTQGNRDLIEATAPMTDVVGAAARARPRDAELGFAYNNENYAVLGQMIEAASGVPYAEACAPGGGSSAAITGRWAPHGPWGGWAMSAAEYGAFVWASFGPDSAIGQAPETWPHINVGSAEYGMGALWRNVDERTLFWASGQLCWDGVGDGSYFASYGGEWLVVVLYSDCLAGTDRLGKLDAALFGAAVQGG